MRGSVRGSVSARVSVSVNCEMVSRVSMSVRVIAIVSLNAGVGARG